MINLLPVYSDTLIEAFFFIIVILVFLKHVVYILKLSKFRTFRRQYGGHIVVVN